MKMADFDGVATVGFTGLLKDVLVNTQREEIRKFTRERKVLFPQQLAREKERKSRKAASNAKRGIFKGDKEIALVLKYGVQVEEEEIEIFTASELARFEEIDQQRAQSEKMPEYDIVLDCELVFSEDEEVEE